MGGARSISRLVGAADGDSRPLVTGVTSGTSVTSVPGRRSSSLSGACTAHGPSRVATPSGGARSSRLNLSVARADRGAKVPPSASTMPFHDLRGRKNVARKIFHTFHYARDSHRVSQIRSMGVIEGQRLLPANEWEKVKRGGDQAIKNWINEQMKGRSCVAVLIGSATADRKWVDYEIKKAWADGKGLFGVYIHGLKDLNGRQSSKGRNPFEGSTAGKRSFPRSFKHTIRHIQPVRASTRTSKTTSRTGLRKRSKFARSTRNARVL